MRQTKYQSSKSNKVHVGGKGEWICRDGMYGVEGSSLAHFHMSFTRYFGTMVCVCLFINRGLISRHFQLLFRIRYPGYFYWFWLCCFTCQHILTAFFDLYPCNSFVFWTVLCFVTQHAVYLLNKGVCFHCAVRLTCRASMQNRFVYMEDETFNTLVFFSPLSVKMHMYLPKCLTNQTAWFLNFTN